MALIEFFLEDFSPTGMAKIRAAVAEAYPEDAIAIATRIEWPRPLMIVEGASFGGLEIELEYSGDVVSREARDVGEV